MKQIQINLTTEQYDFLKAEMLSQNKSLTVVISNILDESILRDRQDILENDPIWSVIGIGKDIVGPTNVSQNVDNYLYHNEVIE
ncbi:MAG: hypothetical protein AAF629_05320 [Chloroflexota bacterium]